MARVHQWTKNLLIFVPLFTAFEMGNTRHLIDSIFAFLAFSCLASATYIANDWKDLESDRAHPRKRDRAIASGAVSIRTSIAVAIVLIAASVFLSLKLTAGFRFMLVGYFVLTITYSLLVKRYFLADVILISLLYMWRILAGSIAIGVTTSSWLLAFSTFFFFGLALIKRCAELRSLEMDGRPTLAGRDYFASDYGTLQSIGIAACLSAIVVLCLFINSPETKAQYVSPQLLWAIPCALLYWSTRLWIKTSRGLMHDDPVVYSIRDQGSRILLGGSVVAMLVAHAWRVPVF